MDDLERVAALEEPLCRSAGPNALPVRRQFDELPIWVPWGWPIAGWYETREAVARARRSWAGRIERLGQCGSWVNWMRCRSCGLEQSGRPFFCNDRFCSKCIPDQRAARVARTDAVLATFKNTPRHWVSTLKARPGVPLRDRMKLLRLAQRRFLKRKKIKPLVRGGCTNLEIEGNRAKGWRPHLHTALDSTFIAWAELADVWQSVTGCRCRRPRNGGRPVQCCKDTAGDHDSFDRCCSKSCRCEGCEGEIWGVHISRSAPARELSKYVAKGVAGTAGAELLSAEDLAELALAIRGARLFWTFGVIYDQEEPDETAVEPRVCEKCGGSLEFLERRKIEEEQEAFP